MLKIVWDLVRTGLKRGSMFWRVAKKIGGHLVEDAEFAATIEKFAATGGKNWCAVWRPPVTAVRFDASLPVRVL